MINELTINIGNSTYNFSGWKRYRTYIGQGKIYPDLFRYTEYWGFEVLVGLQLPQAYYNDFNISPQNCVWKVYTEDLKDNFKFIEKWYEEKYDSLSVPYNQITLATQRIDNFLLKFGKLAIFT